MQRVRSYVFFFFLAVTVFFYSLLIFFFSLWAKEDYLSHLATSWGRLNLKLLNYICRLDFEVIGFENVSKENPQILLVKHQSAWETLALRGLLPDNQAWVLKKELTNYPFFGKALIVTGQIAVDRSKGKKALKDLYDQGLAALNKGKNIIIFPEGTRTPYGTSGKYHSGGALLAVKSNASVIPVAHNAGKYWPKGFFIQSGTVTIIFGEPFKASNLTPKQVTERTETWIESQLNKLNTASNI